MIKYFIDTNVLIRAIAKTHKPSERLYNDRSKDKYVNEYLIKEIRRILRSNFGYSDFLVQRAIDDICIKCTIYPDPPPNRFRKLHVRDPSDRLIIQGAIDHDCVLVTGDHHVNEDAKTYVRTMTAEEVYKRRK